MKSFVLGIDVGGTNIKVGLIGAGGRVISRTNLATKSFVRSKNKLISALVDSCQEIISNHNLSKKDILGIGLGLPGLVNTKKGFVHKLVNIPGWSNIPLAKIIKQKTGIPTIIDNDVNVITLGEWKFGAGRGAKNMVCFTLGTGVGGGLIINNELYRGQGFSAGEIGHIPLNEHGDKCACGGEACLERAIGNRYLLIKAKKIFKSNSITLEEVSRLAGKDNSKAILFWEEAAGHLGCALTGVINLLNPDRVVIGGGVSEAFPHFIKPLYKTIRERAMSVPAAMVKIVPAQLKVDAGLIGSYVLVKNAFAR